VQETQKDAWLSWKVCRTARGHTLPTVHVPMPCWELWCTSPLHRCLNYLLAGSSSDNRWFRHLPEPSAGNAQSFRRMFRRCPPQLSAHRHPSGMCAYSASGLRRMPAARGWPWPKACHYFVALAASADAAGLSLMQQACPVSCSRCNKHIRSCEHAQCQREAD
jgi:hypothetical protein